MSYLTLRRINKKNSCDRFLPCLCFGGILLFAAFFAATLHAQTSIIAPGATVKLLSSGFEFTEGPACDTEGNVYFTDQPTTNYRDSVKADTDMLARYNAGMLKRGILKGGQKYYIGACHTEEDVEQTIKAFQEVAEELKG